RRHVDRQEALDLLFFRRRRLDQVEPHGLAGYRRACAQFESRQSLGLWYERAQHAVSWAGRVALAAFLAGGEIVDEGYQVLVATGLAETGRVLAIDDDHRNAGDFEGALVLL